MTAPPVPAAVHRPRSAAGPPLGVLALVSTALFLIGLFVAAAVAHGFPPSPSASAATIQDHFAHHRSAARISAVFQFGAAIPLALYAATAWARLHGLGVRAPGPMIGLVGGVLSAGFLAMSALASWVLSRPEVVAQPSLVRVVFDASWATGAPAHVVFLGLLAAGVAVPALFAGLLPRPFVIIGLVFAAIAELSTLSLAINSLSFLLPIGRFPLLLWLIVAGFLLPRTRRRTGPAADATS